MLALYADYQRVTGDVSTAQIVVDPQLVEAQSRIQEYLSPRILEQGTYTESLRVYSDGQGFYWTGRCFPNARPVLSVSSPAGAIVDGAAIRSVTGAFPDTPMSELLPSVDPYPRVSVTYVGGWTITTGQSNTVPRLIQRAICGIAKAQMAHVSGPAGATSVREGDISVTYKTALTPESQIDAILQTLDGYKLRTIV